MKVLMFGWEFPPHISGGLGTACLGLTQSLVQTGTHILFVVPRAYGDEALNLINASEVLISEKDKSIVIPASTRNLTQTGMEVITIPSGLKPYGFSNHSNAYAIEDWSYEIATTTSGSTNIENRNAKKYKFSGSYGPQLLEEVARYKEVASALAMHHSFDVIHAHDWLTYQAGIAAKEVSGKPLIVHVHATEYDRAASIDKRVFGIECEGLQKADRIVAVSNWTKRILISNYHIAEKKISVVHNGMTTQKTTSSLKPTRMSNQIVTFLGRITFQKGPHYFIEAARKVLTRFPNAHFVVAGSGDLLPAIVDRVAQLRLSSRIHFTGFLKAEEVEHIWAISDLYVMPSVSEPFGIAPLEAIQAGVPVIISKQSGVAEVMPHAIQLDFWNVNKLADTICSVLSHKSLAKTLKKKSKKTLQHITWDAAASKIKTLYHELANNH
jgi:glycogen synthase